MHREMGDFPISETPIQYTLGRSLRRGSITLVRSVQISEIRSDQIRSVRFVQFSEI